MENFDISDDNMENWKNHYPDICIFCLKILRESTEMFAVDDNIIGHFKNLTNSELSKENPEFCCPNCFEELEKTSLFKTRILKNLEQLREVLKNTKAVEEDPKSKSITQNYFENFNVVDVKEEFLEDSQNPKDSSQKYDNIDWLEMALSEDLRNDNRFQCDICSLKFSNEADIKRHISSHKNERTQSEQCSICEKCFLNKKSLKRHQKTCRVNKNEVSDESSSETRRLLKCDVEDCDRSFRDEKSLQKHLKRAHKHFEEQNDNRKTHKKKTHHSKNKASCPICFQSFMMTSMRRHILRVHQKLREFYCDHCPRKFFRKEELQSHLKVHMGPREKTIPCEQCDKFFSCKESLRVHINAFHLKISTICCEICGKSFSTNTNYRIHVRSTHTLERAFKCDKCDKSYFSKGDLVKHEIGTHSGPMVCTICSKVFQSKITLRIHNRMTHQEKKFVCIQENCGKKFSTNHLLEIHRRNQHLGMKKYQCQYCDIRYFKTTDLKRHILSIHMKVKLQCELPGCKSQFARKETYRNHIKSHHKDIGEANIEIMLKRIRHMQMPKLELNNMMDMTDTQAS